MKSKHSVRAFFGFSILAVFVLSVLLWVLPAGATHLTPVVGTITILDTGLDTGDQARDVFSPSAAVSTADRTIRITITDPNMDIPRTFTQRLNSADNGVSLPPEIAGQFSVFLTANPVGLFGGKAVSPIGDLDDDGDVDTDDVVIVSGDLAQAITVTAIDAEVGRVTFNLRLPTGATESARMMDGGFDVRFASLRTNLTRATGDFNERLAVPATGLSTGESITVTLNSDSLQDTNVDLAISGDDIIPTVTSGEVMVTSVSTGGTTESVTIEGIGSGNPGARLTLTYLGRQSFQTTQALASSADSFTITLANTADDPGFAFIGAITGDDLAVALTAGSRTATVTGIDGVAVPTGTTVTFEHTNRQVEVINTGLVPGEHFPLTLNRDRLPAQDNNGDGVFTGGDLTFSITSGAPPLHLADNIGALASTDDGNSGLSSGNTLTLMHTGDDAIGVGVADAEGACLSNCITVAYTGLVDLVTVRTSAADNASMALRLLETAPGSGVFTATLIVVQGTGAQDQANANLDPTSTGTNRPILGVSNGDSVIVTYADKQSPSGSVTARIDIEDEPPEYTNLAPPTDDRVNDPATILTATVQDNRAGVVSSAFNYVTSVGSIGFEITVNGDRLVAPDLSSGDVTITETPVGSGVFVVSYSLLSIPLIRDADAAGLTLGDTRIEWRVFATDEAGNASTFPAIGDAAKNVTFNDQAPAIASVRAISSTQVEVTFDKPMSTASIAPGDFRVAGAAPTAVTFTADPAVIILVVTGLGPSDTPAVELVGEVQDTGGNPLSTATATATDAIAPTLTTVIADNFTTGPITFNVDSNEPIVGSLPTRTFNNCPVAPTTCDVLITPTVSSIINNPQLSWTFNIPPGLGAGLYTMQLDAQDVAGNLGTAGVAGDATAAGAITFQIDGALPAAAVESANQTPLDNVVATPLSLRDPFVLSIDWTSEGREYAGEAGDSHDSVTLTKAVLDEGEDTEMDVLALTSTRDSRTFSVVILGITTGVHTLTFNGQDELGNTRAADERVMFEVTPTPDFNWNLQPGMNLLSLPRNPANRTIDSILGDFAEVDLIFTRDGTRWLVASRAAGSTGNFAGNLTLAGGGPGIDSNHAYFVNSSSTVTVPIEVPIQDPSRPLPEIAVEPGWNLVPVVSILPLGAGAGEVQFGTPVDSNEYLGTHGVTWSRGFTFDIGNWTSVPPGGVGGGEVEVGRGYWVFFLADSTLVP